MEAPRSLIHPSLRVLGIDPGLSVTGYAVLELLPGDRPGRYQVVEAGVLRGGRSSHPLAARLHTIYQGVIELIDALKPVNLALEDVHSQAYRPLAAIQLAHARGAVLLAATHRDLSIHSYAPSRVKLTLTGSGRAKKDQIQRAIQLELGLDRMPEPHDVADACALALCHLVHARTLVGISRCAPVRGKPRAGTGHAG
jgi:crossover junction endodeoxyribonuclease RuvC